MVRDNSNTKLSEHERFVACISDIALVLVESLQSSGKDVNLNGLVGRLSKKYKLKHQPRLTDIISGIPDQHKKYLLPKLKAKPVRTASGVCITFINQEPNDLGRC